MRKITLLAIVLVFLFTLVGCAVKSVTPAETTTPFVLITSLEDLNMDYNVFRFVDKEAGVVCWVSKVSYGYAISCLPLKDTLLD